MSYYINNEYICWKQLSDMISNNKFQYIGSEIYNKIISEVVMEIYELLLRDDILLHLKDYFFRNEEKEKAFIFAILENVISDKDFREISQLNIIENINILEETLTIISVQLAYRDYKFPTDNDYTHIFNEYKAKKVLGLYSLPFNNNFDLKDQPNEEYKRYVGEKLNIHMVHNNLYDELIFRDLYIWRDSKNSNLYIRIKSFEEGQRTNKVKLSDYLSKLLNRSIEVYDSTDDIKYPESSYLLISLLPFVKMEVFDPSTNIEFPFILNNMFYKNKFQYTDYLQKRFKLPLPFPDKENSIIYQFLNKLFQTSEQFNHIIYCLANYFQNLESSKMALVLIGDIETTDTLIYDIIKPIFALRSEYFSSINDNTLKNLTNDSILRDKIFYHISDISASNIKSKKVSQLVLEILKTKYRSAQDAWNNNESYMNGELIVTSCKNSPYPFLKDSYSRCTVFQVKNLSTILEELEIDHGSFNNEVKQDLDNFSNILKGEYLDSVYHRVYDSEEKNVLQFMKNGILKTSDLEKKINEFILAIQSLSLEKFNYLKDDNELYNEFKYNFENKMIAQPLLSNYFNLFNKEIIFNDNSSFIEILKEKAKMFKHTPTDKTKYHGKKRYEIF